MKKDCHRFNILINSQEVKVLWWCLPNGNKWHDRIPWGKKGEDKLRVSRIHICKEDLV